MNDKNDILQMLRDREDEFRLPLRKDGWEKLDADLSALLPEQELIPVRTKTVRRKLYRWAAVAAVALLCLMISVVMSRREEPQKVVAGHPVVESPAKEENTVPASPKEMIPEKPTVARFFPYIQIMDSLMPELHPVDLPEEIWVADVAADSAGQTEPSAPVHGDSGPQPDGKRNVFPYQYAGEKRNSFDFNRFAFGIHAGSNNMTNMGGGFEHSDSWVSQPNHPHKPDDRPGKPDENPSEEIRTKAAIGGGSGSEDFVTNYYYRHHLPVNVGLSVRTFITPRLALETGLSYTYLYSEILEEGTTHDGSQKLHYIGIPLKLSWTFYNWKNLSFYASGGGMIEYCVSASKTGEDLKINRWQPSWNAAVGMQAELRKPLSLFVEPGVSYYYNLNPQYRNSLFRFESMRTAHPFTFTLQVGIRFTY